MDVASVVQSFMARRGPLFSAHGAAGMTDGTIFFFNTLAAARKHTGGACTSLETHRLRGFCEVDGCVSGVAVTHGAATLWMSSCVFANMLVELLTPKSEHWADYCGQVAVTSDAPLFVFDLALALPDHHVLLIFPSLRDNLWRTLTSDPAGPIPLDIPPGLALIVQEISATASLASLAAAAAAASDADSRRVAPTAFSLPLAKRARFSSPGAAAAAPGDGPASAAVFLLSHLLARGPLVDHARRPRGSATVGTTPVDVWRTELYATVQRMAALQNTGAEPDAMARMLESDKPDLFVYLRDIFDRWAPLGDALATKRLEIPAHRVVQFDWLPVTPTLLGTLMDMARTCNKALCDLLLEDATPLSGGDPTHIGARYMRHYHAALLRDASMAEAHSLTADIDAVHEPRCMAVDEGVLVVVRAEHVDLLPAMAIFNLITHCPDRLPVYPVLARMHFVASNPHEPTWAAAAALLLHGESEVTCRLAVAAARRAPVAAAQQQVLPDLLERLMGDLPLSLLLKPKRAALRHALVCIHTAVMLRLPPVGAAVRMAVYRIGKALTPPVIAVEPCLDGPTAGANLAALCLRALAAGAISPDHVLQIFTRDAPAAPPVAPQAQLDGVWMMSALDCGLIDSGEPHRLDADGRRRARTMLRFFAMCDFDALGIAAADAETHFRMIETLTNVTGAHSGNAGLAWDYPVYTHQGNNVSLYDSEFAVVRRDYDDSLAASLLGRAAANAIADTPIRNCAETILSACPKTISHRLEIMREVIRLAGWRGASATAIPSPVKQ